MVCYFIIRADCLRRHLAVDVQERKSRDTLTVLGWLSLHSSSTHDELLAAAPDCAMQSQGIEIVEGRACQDILSSLVGLSRLEDFVVLVSKVWTGGHDMYDVTVADLPT